MIVYEYCVIASVPLDSRYDSILEVDNRSRNIRDITHTQITIHNNTNKITQSTPLGHMADSIQVAYPCAYTCILTPVPRWSENVMHASRNQAEARAQLTYNDLPRYLTFKLVKPSL